MAESCEELRVGQVLDAVLRISVLHGKSCALFLIQLEGWACCSGNSTRKGLMSRHFFLVWGSVSLGDGEGRLVNFCPIYYFLSKVMSPVSCYNSGCDAGLGFSGTLLLVWWSVPLRYWYHISNAAFSFPFLLGRRMQSFFYGRVDIFLKCFPLNFL